MLISQVLEEYIKKYPLYESIKYADAPKGSAESLHPLYVLTQYVIDTLLNEGHKRIAVILPTDNCDIVPMVIAKFFTVLQQESGNESIFDTIQIGQHLRLGKAVVEFLGYEDDKIIYRIDKNSPGCKERIKIQPYHYLFEKTDGALTSEKTWNTERSKIEKMLATGEAFAANRTTLKKTTILLSTQVAFRERLESLMVNGKPCEEYLPYGRVDDDERRGFSLFNKGSLDCIPAIAVAIGMEELYYLLKDSERKEIVSAIVSSPDKFDEVIYNPDTFESILDKGIPFVVFMTEDKFEYGKYLSDFGFEIWHWKPSTMQSEAFLTKESGTGSNSGDSIFGDLSERMSHAALAEFKKEVTTDKGLKKNIVLISKLSKDAENADDDLRKLIRKLWFLEKQLTRLACRIRGDVRVLLEKEFNEIKELWTKQESYYSGSIIEKNITASILFFEDVISKEEPQKYIALDSAVSKIQGENKRVLILVPDKDGSGLDQSRHVYLSAKEQSIQVQTISQFLERQERKFESFDYLFVTYFDKNDYIRIKQTYCYQELWFVLYDYEERWRGQYLRKVDECIPHATIRKTAAALNFSESDIKDKPFDDVASLPNEEEIEISDYNISETIIRSTLTTRNVDSNASDAIEAIPVLLSGDKIAYFYPTHDVIEISALLTSDRDCAVKKEAKHLKKGDRILIRQSEKDIVREKADDLMRQAGELGLREKTDIWTSLLRMIAQNKTIQEMCDILNRNGADCNFQNVRYWLLGETILPREKNVLITIGKIAQQTEELKELGEKFLSIVDSVYDAGKKVQSYHQKAGSWLTRELRNKAARIKAIALMPNACGKIDGIGEILIYTVEEILGKEFVLRNRINRVEDLR